MVLFLVSRLIIRNAKRIYQVNRVTRTAIIFLQTHHHHLVISWLSVALMIGLPIKAGLSLNWQISSTGVIKCQGATSMNCSACGPLAWSNIAQTHLSNRMATCILPSMQHPLETAHGRALRYTTMVTNLKTMFRPGWHLIMMFGSGVLAHCSRIWSRTLISMASSMLLPCRNMTRQVIIAFKTLCPGTGAGNKR